MGWTGLYFKPSSIPGYFKENWERSPSIEDCKPGVRCLGQAFVGRFVLYGVWEVYGSPFGKPDYQFATVVFCQYGNTGSREEFLYKDMDETVGPCESKMPKTLLKKLKTPAFNDFSREWRKRCWKNALGLTPDSVVRIARRYWKHDRAKSIKILESWNEKHPLETINFRSY